MTITSCTAIIRKSGDKEQSGMIGFGSLASPETVLVHPPLGGDLADVDATELSVCISSWATGELIVELIPVAKVLLMSRNAILQVQPEFAGAVDPVVELILTRRPATRPIPKLTTLDELSRHLADPFTGPAAGPDKDEDDGNNPLCRFLGIFC